MAVEDICQLQKEWLEKKIKEMEKSDDVFNLSFLAGIVFAGQVRPDTEPSTELKALLESRGCKWMRFMYCPSRTRNIVCGPHLVHEGRLKQVFRLYEDTNGAFMSVLVPTKDPE